MEAYPKIETLLNRDPETHKVLDGQWRRPEFEYLAKNNWICTEKIDGTNVRVLWDGASVHFGGRTDNAQMPVHLIRYLIDTFTIEKLRNCFVGPKAVCLYGEGYGEKIQPRGGNYKKDGVGFALFDVKIDDWWLAFDSVCQIAASLQIITVPVLESCNLHKAIALCRPGFNSRLGSCSAEGIVVRPTVDLMTRAGHRVMGKIKTSDFLL